MEVKPKRNAPTILKNKELSLIPIKFDFTREHYSLSVYTDGSCYPNPGPGSYAYIIIDDKTQEPVYRFSAQDNDTTSNRMEASAVISAIGLLYNAKVKFVTIYSDSQYVVNCVNLWAENWVAKEAIKANMSLWRLFVEVKVKLKCSFKCKWIRGHAGNKYNELADHLADITSKNQLNEL